MKKQNYLDGSQRDGPVKTSLGMKLKSISKNSKASLLTEALQIGDGSGLFKAALIPFGKFGLICSLLVGCGGKYLVQTYPNGAKVYVRDIQTNEKKLIGTSPVQIAEESKLGDVFFVIFEKENFKPKEVLVKINPGESLTLSARLDPLSGEELAEAAGKAEKKKDDEKPGQPPKDDKKKPEDELKAMVEDLNLRVALLENTVTFYKEAMFSPRFQGGTPGFDRDRNDKVVGLMFSAQQSIVRGAYKEALDQLDQALKMDEYVANAWLLKGSVNFLMKDYEGARTAWERTLKLDAHNKVAYRYLNEVYKRLGVTEMPPKPAELRYPASQVEIEKRSPTIKPRRR